MKKLCTNLNRVAFLKGATRTIGAIALTLHCGTALAGESTTYSLKVLGGMKNAAAQIGSLNANVVDVKGYQTNNEFVSFGPAARFYTYGEDDKVTGGDGFDLGIDFLLHPSFLKISSIGFSGYGKLGQTLFSDHTYKTNPDAGLGYDSSKFVRHSTSLALGLLYMPGLSIGYSLGLSAEIGYSFESLSKRKALRGGAIDDSIVLPFERLGGVEFLLGLVLTKG